MSKLNQFINQAVISFTFAGDTFDVHCHLEGVKSGSKLFNALEAMSFVPVYDLDHNCYEFITPEELNMVMPNSLKPQAI